MDKIKIIELIRNALALGQKDKNNSMHEAETAITMAHKLMKKYNISMSDVEVEHLEEAKTNQVIALKKISISCWEWALMRSCENLFNVGYFVRKARNFNTWRFEKQVTFYGLESDVAIAVSAFRLLHRVVVSQSKKWYEDYEERTSYRNGITDTIENRVLNLRKQQKEDKTEDKQEIQDNQKYALIVLKKDSIVNRMTAKMNIKNETVNQQHGFEYNAYNHGKSDGHKVNLNFHKAIGGRTK